MNAISGPTPAASTVRGIVEEDPRLVAELGARGPIEPRVCRMRIFRREVRSLPVFDQQDRVAAKGPQRGDRRVEVDVEQIPSNDRDPRVLPNAAAFLHGNDDGVRWRRAIAMTRRASATRTSAGASPRSIRCA